MFHSAHDVEFTDMRTVELAFAVHDNGSFADLNVVFVGNAEIDGKNEFLSSLIHYMIGPWENYGRDDFSIIHPPEISIDFDAVYTDGQKGLGTVETDSHPIKIMGNKVSLNGTLENGGGGPAGFSFLIIPQK